MADSAPSTMSLVLFHSPAGRLTQGWRREGSRVEELMSIELAAFSAQRAEAACIDAIFFADKVVHDQSGLNPDISIYEPTTTLGAMSVLTRRIGLISTISTTFTQPYNTARILTQLDHLSKGRAGWNVVTSFDGAQNFSTTLPPKAERYEWADDFIEATYALWDAWDDDAVVIDRGRGIWAHPEKIRAPHYRGRHYSVDQALSMPPSPQGRPVIAQAGQSAEGMAFAAKHAEVIFTAKNTIDIASSFTAEIKTQAERLGRSRSGVKILPGLVPIIGSTEAEAVEIADEIADLYQLEIGLKDLKNLLLGIELSDLALEDRIPLERLVSLEDASRSSMFEASRYPNLRRLIVEESPTLRELLRRHTRQYGHQTLIGTAEFVADEMEHWFQAGACDGFTLIPAYMPEGLERVCDEVIPILQERGLFRTEYPGTTLRDTLGIRAKGELDG